MDPILVILGPTASGKSGLAMGVALRLEGEIVNADALQVYRGFDIGTAKPSVADRALVAHHLVDILEPTEQYSAGSFVRHALKAIAEIQDRGQLAIVVGGSGLYLKALLEGISPMPEGDPALRSWLDTMGTGQLATLRRMLEVLDPVTAARVPPGDRQRTSRALEIVLSSGRPQSWWIARRPFHEENLSAWRIGLTLPRAILYDRIAARVSEMLESGWVKEVESLLAAGIDPSAPAFQAIGYRQLARHVLGECTIEDAVEETVQATRRFAKRQLTWFRSQRGIRWLAAGNLEDSVVGIIRSGGIWGAHV